MKSFTAIIISAVFLASLLCSCSGSQSDALNSSKIKPNQTAIQRYPGLDGKYYADGDTKESARDSLINKVVPDILKKEITEHDDIEVTQLDIKSSQLTCFDRGDVARLTLEAALDGGEPIERVVLVFITSERLEQGYRSYFLSYHNMDQTDDISSDVMLEMLNDFLEKSHTGG